MSLPIPQLDTQEDYRKRFASADYWAPYAAHVCRKHGLKPATDFGCHNPGTYPTVIVNNRWVIKFFGLLYDGAAAYDMELAVNVIVAENAMIPAPRIVGMGALFYGTGTWRWPYLIFEFLAGVHLGQVFDTLDTTERLKIAGHLGFVVRNLHQIDCTSHAFCITPQRSYYDLIEQQRPGLTERYQRSRSLPEHLIDQIDGYLLPSEALTSAYSPVLLHGDITGDHIMLRQVQGRGSINGLIDFGDACIGDPEYELVALHLDAFHCNDEMLTAYLHVYGVPELPRQLWQHKMMSLTLLHRFHIVQSAVQYMPELVSVRTLEEVANRLWNPACHFSDDPTVTSQGASDAVVE